MNPEEEAGSEAAAVEEETGEQESHRTWNGMEAGKVKAVLEAILYVSEQPLSLDRMIAVIGDCTKKEIRGFLESLNAEYVERGSAFEIIEVANGYQVRTRPEFAAWIGKLTPQKPIRLSRAALESLAIIAYRQPVTRAEVEQIRGVDTGAVIGSLLEKRLLRILGRKEVPGRPIIYGTSQEFLDLFGLKNLGSLPTLREIEGMFEKQEEEVAAEAQEAAGETADAAAGDSAGTASAGQGGDASGGDGGGAEEAQEEGGSVPAGMTAVEGSADETGGATTPEDASDEEEPWTEDEGDLETAELDDLLKAAKTKVLSYEEVLEQEAAREAAETDGLEEENGEVADEEEEAWAGQEQAETDGGNPGIREEEPGTEDGAPGAGPADQDDGPPDGEDGQEKRAGRTGSHDEDAT